ncbi:hypothetical protein I3271_05720 [Photobacterium leiognathi]|nr:hypothetical protein [Photobacterium leiognathi]
MILDLELATVVFVLSILSGVGSFLHGRREGRLKGGGFDCITEMVLSLVSGFVVAFFGNAYSIHPSITCALSLLAANNGAEFLTFSKSVFRRYLIGILDKK